jgi:hypothetical protein
MPRKLLNGSSVTLVFTFGLNSNENKISDAWRDSAWLLVEGGISWKVRSRDCQPFAASLG